MATKPGKGPLAKALGKVTEEQARVVYELLRGYVWGGQLVVNGVVTGHSEDAAYTLLTAMDDTLEKAKPVQPKCVKTSAGWMVVPDPGHGD